MYTSDVNKITYFISLCKFDKQRENEINLNESCFTTCTLKTLFE